jgi:hypothetical protein
MGNNLTFLKFELETENKKQHGERVQHFAHQTSMALSFFFTPLAEMICVVVEY